MSMGSNSSKLDHPVIGVIIGMVAPLFGCFIYYFVQSAEMHGLEVSTYMEMLKDNKILSMILSWSLLVNLLFFSLFNRFDKVRLAQGIVWATILYGVLIIYLKLF
ncbi:MAG: hypothetical protein GY751_04770 [Bacteroidetes bacterium]|nr:hypothetical protein [Bacteroidota bacterium]